MKSSTFYLENLKTTADNRFSKMQPNWERVQITKESNQLVYEVELTNPDQLFIGTSEVKLSDAKKFASKNLIRLLIFKEAATDKILQGCYMSIMSDDQNERINSFSYKKMDGFSGKIMYYHLDGSIANGWVYKSGNIIASISKSETQVPNIILNKSLSANRNEVPGKTLNKQILDQDCITESFPYFNYACAGVEGYEKCGWMVAGYDQVTTCYNPVGEGGSSGDEGGYTPPRRDCAGKVNGTAYIDPNCNTCIGGTTGLTECPPKDIRNKTTDTCISKTVEELLAANKDIEGAMADIVKNFDASKNVKINVFDGNIPKPGQTTNQQFIGNNFSADITLSIDYHANTSKENIIATMIHEVVHAYLGFSSNNFLKTETDHNVIAEKYITPMASYLTQYFGMQTKDAYALAWSGVPDSKVFEDANDDFEFTMSDGNKITKAETRNLSGPYKLSTNTPANNGYTKGTKICD